MTENAVAMRNTIARNMVNFENGSAYTANDAAPPTAAARQNSENGVTLIFDIDRYMTASTVMTSTLIENPRRKPANSEKSTVTTENTAMSSAKITSARVKGITGFGTGGTYGVL